MKFRPSNVYFTQRERLVIGFVVAAFLLGTTVWHVRRYWAAERIAKAATRIEATTQDEVKF